MQLFSIGVDHSRHAHGVPASEVPNLVSSNTGTLSGIFWRADCDAGLVGWVAVSRVQCTTHVLVRLDGR